MDSWEWNKIAGAVLGTAIFVMVIGIISDTVYEVPTPAKPGYIVKGVTTAASTASSGPAKPQYGPLPDFAKAIPAASIAEGKKISMKCAQCHDWTKGGPNKIGPNLFGIVGSKAGTVPGFNFSAAMKKSGITWTDEKLEAYVMHPQQVVPGNRMPFGGLSSKKPADDLVAYLDTLK